jgi:hypothetical protein
MGRWGMLKEERELRKYLRESVTDDYPDEFINIRREWGKLITLLVRAVREDCAKVAEEIKHEYGCAAPDKIAAAIRGKK